jgi:hypothetical protein
VTNSMPDLGEKVANGQPDRAGAVRVPGVSGKALISAPYTTDTSLLRLALEEHGLEPFELDELKPGGRGIPQLLEDCLADAELVVALFEGGPALDQSRGEGATEARAMIEFQLGFAAAMKKRILTLVPLGQSQPYGLPCFYFDPQDRQAIRNVMDYSLDVVLSTPPKLTTSYTGESRDTVPIGSLADTLLAEIRGRAEIPPGHFERLARALFEASGVNSVFTPPEMITPGRRVDMVVFSEDFIPWLNDPLPVDLRGSITSPSELNASRADLGGWLDQIHQGWGLLIHHGNGPSPGEGAIPHPRVLDVSAEQLLESLRGTSLGDFLRQLRNRRVRGQA